MMSQNRSLWVEAGYKVVAYGGFQRLGIESIARDINKSKSSFYHYFGDMDVFIEELLALHLAQVKLFAERIKACPQMKPDVLNVFIDQRTDLFFHKQLRIHRADPVYRGSFEKTFKIVEDAAIDQWMGFLGLGDQPIFARTFLHLVAENFLLQITQDSFDYAWLENYLNEVSGVLQQMNVAARK